METDHMNSDFSTDDKSAADTGRISNSALQFVANRIVGQWRLLAWQLGVANEVVQAAGFNNPNDVAGKAMYVLLAWKKMRGDLASWAELEKVLNDLGQQSIAEAWQRQQQQEEEKTDSLDRSEDVVLHGARARSVGIPQQYKALAGLNIRSETELRHLGRSLGLPDRVMQQIECDGMTLADKAGMVVTKWENRNGRSAYPEAYCSILEANGLGHLLKPADRAASTRSAEKEPEQVLLRYLRYLIEQTEYVDMVGTGRIAGSERMLLDRVYVALRIERTNSYERSHQVVQLDNEMKALLASKNISWETLSLDEKLHLIHVYLSELPLSQSISSGSEDEITEIPIAQAFKEHNVLVVLGDPGSGKTTMAKWLALKLATAYLESSSHVVVPYHQVYVTVPLNDDSTFDMGLARVPVFVRISAFAEFLKSCKSGPRRKYAILDFLGSKAHGSYLTSSMDDELFGDPLNERLAKLFFDGKITLILDGLDEVAAENDRRNIVDCVKGLIALCRHESSPASKNQIVVTSRIAGYSSASLLPDTVVHFTVQRMSRQAIDKFVDCWMTCHYGRRSQAKDRLSQAKQALQAATNLKKAIYDRDHPSVFLLASNPLLITLIAMIFAENKELPRERASLYEITFHYLVKTWREDCTKFTDDDQKFIEESLQEVAFEIHSTVQTNYIHEPKLISRMMAAYNSSVSKDNEKSPREAEKYIVNMVAKLGQSVGLLIEKVPHSFSFIHLPFQEFLAGCWLLRDRTKTTSLMLEYLNDPRWREPILLAFGHASIKWTKAEFNQLLSSMLQTNSSDDGDNAVLLALLIARSLPEFRVDSVEDSVLDQLLDILVTSFHVQLQSRCKSTTKVVEKSLRHLKTIPQCKVRLESVLDTWSASGCSYKRCAAAALAVALKMMTVERQRMLCEFSTDDIPKLGMPIHTALRHVSYPDVEQFFETETAITDVDGLYDALLELLKPDGDTHENSVVTELSSIRASYDSSNTLSISLKEEFFSLWKRWLKEFRDVADKSTVTVYEDFTPELGLHGDILDIRTPLQIGFCITSAAIAASLNLFHEVKLSTRERECNPEIAALLAAAEMVNCFVWSHSHELSRQDNSVFSNDEVNLFIDSLTNVLSMITPFPNAVLADGASSSMRRILSSLTLCGITGKDEALNVFRRWISGTMMTAAKLLSETIVIASKQHSIDATSASESLVRSWLQTEMGVSDIPTVSNSSTGQLKVAIPAMIAEGLDKLTETTSDEYQRLERAMNVLYDSLDLLEMYNKSVESLDVLQKTRKKYHEQPQICDGTYRKLASFRLAVLPPRRDFLRFRSFVTGMSFVSRLQSLPSILKKICDSSGLFRLFVALYGGISNLGYIAALQCVRNGLAFEQAPQIVQQQIMQLQISLSSTNVSRDQFLKERKHRKSVVEQAQLLESVKPILRLCYTYRSSSSMDEHLKKALVSRHRPQTNDYDLELILEQADKAWSESNSTLTELCDAAKCICAAGNVDDVVCSLHEKTYSFEVSASLAESLAALIEPACREIQQLLTSDRFTALLSSEDNLELVKSVLTLNKEFGGFISYTQLLKLVQISNCNQIKALFEAEVIATSICSVSGKYDVFRTLWKTTDTEKIEAKQAQEAVQSILNIREAAGSRSRCRLRWLPVFEHQFSTFCQYPGHPYTIDLVFSLMEICRTVPAQCTIILSAIAPERDDREVSLLWKSFCLAVSTVEVPPRNWMNIFKLWQEIETEARSVENVFIRGQIQIALAITSNKKKQDLLKEVIALCKRMPEEDASMSSQLLFWALVISPACDFYSILDVFESRVRQLSTSLEKGMKMAFVSALRDGSKRNDIVRDALSALPLSVVDTRLARVVRRMFGFVDSCKNPDIRMQYNKIMEGMPDLVHIARGHKHYAIETWKSSFQDSNVGDVLLLTARLRDCLADVQACFSLCDERLLWEAVSNGDERTRALAKSELKKKTKTSYLDLTSHSALLLEHLLKCEETFVIDVLPYMRILELEVCCMLKKWICDDSVARIKFDKVSETDIIDLANLLLAEQEGLNFSNTESVIKLLKCDLDVCRRRAEALLSDESRLYYTALVESEWLRDITSRYLDLCESNDLRCTVVQWIYKHICHNDRDYYSKLLRFGLDDSENTVIIRRALRVDEHIGEILLNSLTDQDLSSCLKRKLLTSLCQICYHHSSNFPSAAPSFYQRLQEVFRRISSDTNRDLDTALAYTGNPETLLREAEKAIGDSKQKSDYGTRLNIFLATVNCPILKAVSYAIEVLDGKKSSSDLPSDANPISSLIVHFEEHLASDTTKEDTASQGSSVQKCKEADAFRCLLRSMIKRNWIPIDVALDPSKSLKTALDSRRYNFQVVEVLADWSSRLLRRSSKDDMLLPSALLDDLLLCLAETSSRTPAAFSNWVQEEYEDFPHLLSNVATSNESFPRRQAALMVLANLGKLSMDVSNSLLSGLSENMFVSTLVLTRVGCFVEADQKAIEFLCERLDSGSSLVTAMICRLLATLAANKRLSLTQRNWLVQKLNKFATGLREDQPIVLFRQESKSFDHPTLAAVVGETITSTWGFVVDEALTVPFQLGQPDGNGIYKYTADEATPIWYRYCKPLNCWYWTPYEDFSSWMPASTLVVTKGFWSGQKPVAANQHCIRYLNLENPVPPTEVIDIHKDWIPGE